MLKNAEYKQTFELFAWLRFFLFRKGKILSIAESLCKYVRGRKEEVSAKVQLA